MNNEDAMHELRDQVGPGWTVDIVDHYHLAESRESVAVDGYSDNGLVLRPKRAWATQGRKFSTMLFTWDGDMEVSGTVVRMYTTHTGLTSRTRPGQRECIQTFAFHPPVV